jgi:hypothetical protein
VTPEALGDRGGQKRDLLDHLVAVLEWSAQSTSMGAINGD